MEFKLWLEESGKSKVNSVNKALQVLELQHKATEKDIRNAYIKLSKGGHPDLGGSNEQQVLLNAAFEYLRDRNFNTNGSYEPSYASSKHDNELPPWQTDLRSSYNVVGHDFRNKNFCMKTIYEKAIENGGNVSHWSIQAFDGHYFRGSFIVFCNKKTLGFAGMVMEQWNSHGANSYDTNAVFASQSGEKELILIRLNGTDVSNKDITFEHESFSDNPANDQHFMRELKAKLANLSSV